MRLLVLDNYDSFVYNIVHIIKELGFGSNMEIHRNDKISIDEVKNFDKILLSPGPGVPSEAGILHEIVKKYGAEKDIFGVCLGHQGIGEVYGASLINLDQVYHGLSIKTKVSVPDYIFNGLPQEFMCGRYHSWAVDPKSNLDQIEVTAADEKGNIMALRHKKHKVRGVQFHPESVLTENGKLIMKNWLNG
ncbi:MAG: aminodeoxychorismate/anthranilate synthase component II [Sporocytophaga sp.]|uniref:anthranilate synthase component II n=1 Tax=Sporocytophaga sp. TaxID=2231183 RepID=UPI001AFDD672|nr:aminodeoxychorismate/anthranilate synthase component II [Sporocytophaga sp.]MBO9698743.1 aminodeoxychorismate/anthranilate synthase component II [Sporocytophaga sp.]